MDTIKSFLKSKSMKKLILGSAFLMPTLLFSNFLLAAPKVQSTQRFDYNSFVASEFAQDSVEIKKPEDIKRKFLTTKKQMAEFDSEMLKKPVVVPKMNVSRKGTQVTLKTATKIAVLDFKNFDQKKIFVNGIGVRLNSQKTYSDYHKEVLKALSPKKAFLNYLFSEVFAESSEDSFLGSYIAWRNTGSSTQNISVPWADSYITDVLNQSYENEYSYLMSSNNAVAPGSRKFNWSSIGFTCENNRVSRVAQLDLVAKNISTPQNYRKSPNLVREGNGFKLIITSLSSINNEHCESVLDANGVVISKSGSESILDECPGQGINVFEEGLYPFGAFPLAADLCCQQQGCYEKVIQERKSLVARMLGTHRPGQESTDPAGANGSGAVE